MRTLSKFVHEVLILNVDIQLFMYELIREAKYSVSHFGYSPAKRTPVSSFCFNFLNWICKMLFSSHYSDKKSIFCQFFQFLSDFLSVFMITGNSCRCRFLQYKP